MKSQVFLVGYLQSGIDALCIALDFLVVDRISVQEHERGGFKYEYERFGRKKKNERAWSKCIHRPLLNLYGKEEVKDQLRTQTQLKP